MELGTLAKHKNKLLSLIVIIIALIISNNIYKKQSKELELLKEKINLEIKKNSVLANIAQLEKRIDAYKHLLGKKEPSSIISNISNIAKVHAIKISSIRQAQELSTQEYIKFPFNIVVSAPDYHALGEFISRLESASDVYLVEDTYISSDTQTEELTVNLTVSSIAYRD